MTISTITVWKYLKTARTLCGIYRKGGITWERAADFYRRRKREKKKKTISVHCVVIWIFLRARVGSVSAFSNRSTRARYAFDFAEHHIRLRWRFYLYVSRLHKTPFPFDGGHGQSTCVTPSYEHRTKVYVHSSMCRYDSIWTLLPTFTAFDCVWLLQRLRRSWKRTTSEAATHTLLPGENGIFSRTPRLGNALYIITRALSSNTFSKRMFWKVCSKYDAYVTNMIL